jgi:hypothetical protein
MQAIADGIDRCHHHPFLKERKEEEKGGERRRKAERGGFGHPPTPLARLLSPPSRDAMTS